MAKKANKANSAQAVQVSFNLQLAFVGLVGLLLLIGVYGLVNLVFIGNIPRPYFWMQLGYMLFPMLLVATAFGLLGRYRALTNRLFMATLLATMAYAISTAGATFINIVGLRFFYGNPNGPDFVRDFVYQMLPLVATFVGFVGVLLYKNARLARR